MPEIKGLPKYEPKPGANPLRVKTIEMLRAMASDPTSLEVMPLGGMTRALKGTPAYHGFRTPIPYVRWSDMAKKAEKILEAKFGKRWPFDAGEGALADLTDSLVKQAEKASSQKYMFSKFEETKAGMGAGGNLYDEAIYLSGHPKVSRGYGDTIRKHNIPPQAKILDINKPLTEQNLMQLFNALDDHQLYISNRKHLRMLSTKQRRQSFNLSVNRIRSDTASNPSIAAA